MTTSFPGMRFLNADPSLQPSLNNIQNVQASYFNLNQNQFNEMIALTFETDVKGKILYKSYQCHQCLELCHSQQFYETHILNCANFSCPYLACRDLTYQNIYRTKKMFQNKSNMLSHIAEHHESQNISRLNNKGDLRFEKEIKTEGNAFDLEKEMVWYSIPDSKLKEFEKNISDLQSINIKLKEENNQVKDINSNLTLSNAKLKKELTEKDKNVSVLLDNIQTNIVNFENIDRDQCKNAKAADFKETTYKKIISNTSEAKNGNEKYIAEDNIGISSLVSPMSDYSHIIARSNNTLETTEEVVTNKNIQKDKANNIKDTDYNDVIHGNLSTQTAKEEEKFQWRETNDISDTNENNDILDTDEEVDDKMDSFDYQCSEDQDDFIENHEEFKDNVILDHKETKPINDFVGDHPCIHCNANLENASELSIHSIPVPCIFCETVSPCVAAWRDHLNQNHPRPLKDKYGSRKFTCPSCGYTGMRSKVIYHFETSHGGKVYSCFSVDCGISYSTRELLVRHVENTHVDSKEKREQFQSVECELCGKVLINKGIFLSHMRLLHTGNETIKCEWCEKTFKNKRYKTDHENRMHLETAKITCEICGIKVTKLDDHMMRRHPENVDPEKLINLLCQYCEFQTKIRGSLQKHIQRVHQEKTIQCEKCPFRASMNSFLNIHMKRAHGDERFYIYCKFEGCDRQFFIENEMQNHVKQTHPDGVFDCIQCGKRFVNQLKWRRHMKYHNLDTEGFPCAVCDKKFISKQKVAEHMNLHTGETPFKCRGDECQKAFSTSSALSHHEKNCTNRRQ